jgi:hypothetical protein
MGSPTSVLSHPTRHTLTHSQLSSSHRYREFITDIALKMETGMADFAHRAAIAKTAPYLDTIAEYDLYYVAGLVGEGLS